MKTMITWIVGGLLLVWVIIRRNLKNGKIKGYPLGMPRGTIRALITVMIVTFPFNNLITATEIPRGISSAIFILIAFYFQGRKSGGGYKNSVEKVVDKLKNINEKNRIKEKHPLYLPKYTVRVSLILILILFTYFNVTGPFVTFQSTDTIIDILLIIILFIFGSFFRKIGIIREKKRILIKIKKMENYKTLSKNEIFEKITPDKVKPWIIRSKNLLSVFTLTVVVTSLIFYTIDFAGYIMPIPFYNISIRGGMLLIIDIYYGFRD